MAPASRSRRSDPRPLNDRLVFKPLALLLLVPVIMLSGALMAFVLAPPFVGAALGVMRVDAKLEALGADFTRIPRFPERSTIYANDGETVLATVFLDNRQLVRLKNVSEPAQKAVLAIEDSSFYEHGALSWNALLRAIIENARAGEVVQGGSTITQQLAKNTLGLDPNDVSFERKFQELALAIRVEEKYTKEEIFELYLNQIYLGNGVYGIGTAAEFYFHKPASKLSLTEGAMLAGIIKEPGEYDPFLHPVKTKVRRNEVLVRMGALGTASPFGISSERLERARHTPLDLPKGAGKRISQRNQPFFVKYMIRQILGNADGAYDALGRSEKARQRTLFEGGLKIVTTMDPVWQEYAQQAAEAPYAVGLASTSTAHPDTSIVSVDPSNGAIRTMVSGKNFVEDELDLAATPHPTGSAFKPFVLAAAFEQGVPPTQTYSSASPFCSPEWDDVDHCVSNAEGGSAGGKVDLWSATENSINVVFAQLILDIGPETVPPVASKMGISVDLPPVASLATGSAEVSPLDMAVGYATLANGGTHCSPYTVQTILRDGKTLYEHEANCERVLRPDIAHLITAMLERVPKYGTAASAFSSGGWGAWPVAGKTGTADLNKAVWFCGYTAQLATAVWVGSNGNPYTLGSVFGGTVAAPIWRSYMYRVMTGLPAVGFPDAPDTESATVPDVVGLSSDEAIAALQAAGFRATLVEVDSIQPAGTVVAQVPGGGALADLGIAVRLDVSTGRAPDSGVPAVVGLRKEAARSLLIEAGFEVRVRTVHVTDPTENGVVLSQSPGAGTPTTPGSVVTITVGRRN